MLNQFIKVDEEGRKILPCYYSMLTILDSLKHWEIPIMITAPINDYENITLLFIYSQFSNQFKLITEEFESYAQHPCFKITGNSTFTDVNNWIIRALDVGLEQLILFNMAMHPQFSGKKLKNEKASPY